MGRKMRQQDQIAEVANDWDDEEEDNQHLEMDAYELTALVEILSKLPKDFLKEIEGQKWQDRKIRKKLNETITKNFTISYA